MARLWMSVVLPAYNEEAAIAPTVSAVRDWLARAGRPYEILVVDNASEDRTAQRVRDFQADAPVRLLRNDSNRGKGYSVRRGMLAASGELCLHCDADCAPCLASLDEMLALLEDADIVAGSRSAPGAQVEHAQPLRRRLVGWPFIALSRLLLREPTKDIYCGFKLWRREAAEAVFSRMRLDGWVFDAEALALARRLGFRVREAGVVWDDREGSRLSISQVLVPAVRELLAARRSVRRDSLAVAGRTPSEPLVADPRDPAR
jgi:dolichyl-phosphate beta-glucosyltransferase